MKFITAEQFSKADKKVRDSIMEWWEPSIGDLYEADTAEEEGKEKYPIFLIRFSDDIILMNKNKPWYIPLLTVGQLIEFIEWKSGKSISIEQGLDKAYDIWLTDEKNNPTRLIEDNRDLLMALWEVSQKVCE